MGRPAVIGQVFGKLTVLEILPKERFVRLKVKCLCKCGEITYKSIFNLVSKNTTSCGRRCRLAKNKKPPGEAAKTAAFLSYTNRARQDQIEFKLSKTEFFSLTSKDCSYCGSPPVIKFMVKHRNGGCLINGLDRVDSNLGYTKDNVVPCCTVCNKMKSDLTFNEFIAHIDRIHKFSFKGIK